MDLLSASAVAVLNNIGSTQWHIDARRYQQSVMFVHSGDWWLWLCVRCAFVTGKDLSQSFSGDTLFTIQAPTGTHLELPPPNTSVLISLVGPIPWGHSGPLCHALSLLSSSLRTSMRRRRATVAACDSSNTWWMAM